MNYVIFDLEATCWRNDKTKRNEIIEIGAVKLDVEGKTIGEFQAFVKPIVNHVLSDFCVDLTSIKQSDVDDAKTFDVVVKEFREWIGESYLLCSWGHYDKSQLVEDCNLHHIESSWADKHISLKHQYMEKFNVSKRKSGMKQALRGLGIPLTGTHHRGIDDARNIAKIFVSNIHVWDLG